MLKWRVFGYIDPERRKIGQVEVEAATRGEARERAITDAATTWDHFEVIEITDAAGVVEL